MKNQADIIKGCKQNNRLSQEKLYMQCYPVLDGLCKRFFDDEHEIVTAINNGMLRVFKNIGEYNEVKSELITWIYTIVRNEALTMIRNKNTVVGTTELTTELSTEITIEPFSKATEQDAVFYLRKLPGTTRAACSLFYIEGYSIREIASSLDMKEGTVKWHLNEGRKQLQSTFKKKNDRFLKAG